MAQIEPPKEKEGLWNKIKGLLQKICGICKKAGSAMADWFKLQKPRIPVNGEPALVETVEKTSHLSHQKIIQDEEDDPMSGMEAQQDAKPQAESAHQEKLGSELLMEEGFAEDELLETDEVLETILPPEADEPLEAEPALSEAFLEADEPLEAEPALSEALLGADEPLGAEPAHSGALLEADEPLEVEPALSEALLGADEPLEAEPALSEALLEADPALSEALFEADEPLKADPALSEVLLEVVESLEAEPALSEEPLGADESLEAEPARNEEWPEANEPLEEEPAAIEELLETIETIEAEEGLLDAVKAPLDIPSQVNEPPRGTGSVLWEELLPAPLKASTPPSPAAAPEEIQTIVPDTLVQRRFIESIFTKKAEHPEPKKGTGESLENIHDGKGDWGRLEITAPKKMQLHPGKSHNPMTFDKGIAGGTRIQVSEHLESVSIKKSGLYQFFCFLEDYQEAKEAWGLTMSLFLSQGFSPLTLPSKTWSTPRWLEAGTEVSMGVMSSRSQLPFVTIKGALLLIRSLDPSQGLSKPKALMQRSNLGDWGRLAISCPQQITIRGGDAGAATSTGINFTEAARHGSRIIPHSSYKYLTVAQSGFYEIFAAIDKTTGFKSDPLPLINLSKGSLPSLSPKQWTEPVWLSEGTRIYLKVGVTHPQPAPNYLADLNQVSLIIRYAGTY